MFTGIVQSLGIVKNIRPKDGDLEITVKADQLIGIKYRLEKAYQ